MADLIRNIKAFPNTIRKYICLLYMEDFSYPLKIYVVESEKKGQSTK